ncbi:MAG: DNA damage-inducible protein D [Saprospiraceae bacterium]
MKKAAIIKLFNDFESLVNKTADNIEFWFARDLQHLLGYMEWRNFQKITAKAKIACENTGDEIDDHFLDASRKVTIGSGVERAIDDVMLTRYACYLIAQNGDSKKEEVAFAQSYFATKARKAELIEQRIQDIERLKAREKLATSESELSQLIYDRTGDNFAIIRSRGDKALFNQSTQEMKDKLGVPKGRPLADFLENVLVRGKAFATEITVFNTKEQDLKTVGDISDEHITNNSEVRGLLLKRGIVPENLPPQEDIKKLERRVNRQDKKSFKDKRKLT